ncbi:hypothetical protein JQ616_06280 [Bradyrhizobium tropiciagri]|uniref:hypothetical protein n=1 Tax=Bradyrhizobium tropiciagri TaxID=312253 RepID=UPI001BA74CB5|nr:hypothetical protein [Bradyrhizobium tropiciagri]MBR0894552.1 hypothetical protein [Bradyrhizobium tropiciagri]
MKFPETVDREVFWTWAVPLVIAHVALSLAGRAGITGVSALDTVAVLWLARLLARRFRNIGWSGWIGASFLIGTMLVIPLGIVGYAIANKLPPAQFETLTGAVGLVSAVVNLVLLIVAGSVPGKASPNPEVEAASGPGQPAVPATAPDPVIAAVPSPDQASLLPAAPVPSAQPGKPDVLAISVNVAFAVAVIGLVVALLFPRQHATQALTSPPPVSNSGGYQTQSNGLTKDTNDFLRQLSQQSRGQAHR